MPFPRMVTLRVGEADPPFRGGGFLPFPALLRACGNHSDEAERLSGVGVKLFGFIAKSVFTFIPGSCSGSSRSRTDA
jgi:hypothetical protein